MNAVGAMAILHVAAIAFVAARLRADLRFFLEAERMWEAFLRRGLTDVATVGVTVQGASEWIALGPGRRSQVEFLVQSAGFVVKTENGEHVDVPAGTTVVFAGEAWVNEGVVYARRGAPLLATLVEVANTKDSAYRTDPRRFQAPQELVIIVDPAHPLRACTRMVRWSRVAWLLALSCVELLLVACSPRFNALALFTAALALVLGFGGGRSRRNTLLHGLLTRPLDPSSTIFGV